VRKAVDGRAEGRQAGVVVIGWTASLSRSRPSGPKAVLRVPGALAEPETDRGRVAAELAAELDDMAGWLGLFGVMATALRKAVGC
jgi:uncharacterized protein YcaQ